jgi:putative redox protein
MLHVWTDRKDTSMSDPGIDANTGTTTAAMTAPPEKPTTAALWAADDGVTACAVVVGDGTLRVDLDVEAGGDPAHPSPHDLLDAALAACTSLTLELYTKRKGWVLPKIHVEVTHAKTPAAYVMIRRLDFGGPVTEEQLASLLRIADACPVHKTLMGSINIETTVA